MESDQRTGSSGRPTRTRDEGDVVVFTKAEMKEFIRVAGRPWHNRKKKISLKRVRALMDIGFSYRQIAKIYHTSETTIRRRLRGE